MNRLVISGALTQIDPLRYSPAGVPIVEAVVHHRSSQTVASQARQVECELTVQASGSLASQLAQITVGTQVRMEGALNRRSVNSRQLLLILNRIEKE
ncbi:MAG TPA: primosomal replication protein N [Thiobacillus sp.]|nr:MAG: primosomal replication protein N [Hydrogenophilales bacterium 28-61-11]OYZ58976.1 MAG: primosomal replication protein N [Hydrogenophilales bacterium 16-61-112]OZA46902.1 MAG: primosomal replication protein N [Hydrogenophilales bacterium 17-61-76]HQT31892.1 primosomal replication protein N [Thiobacillus sp.]HQT70527.1 primosomal replication protein N [Thiobacillus sp.]